MASCHELTVFECRMIIGLHKGDHSASDISQILGILISRTTYHDSRQILNLINNRIYI